MANFFTSASTNFVLDHQLSPRRLSTSSHHVEFRDLPRRLSAHVEFRDLPCSHIDGHLQPPPHLYHRRRSSDVSHDRHHHHKGSDGNTSFLRAARDGNLQEVLEYLKGSTDINTSNPELDIVSSSLLNGLNALHLASKEGHIDIVQELLKRGANVEAATKKGNTALHIASLAGHLNIVKLLVDNGAKYDVQAHVGFTPLYMAAQEGHADVVKYLLSSGANQSLSTKDGFTPLAVALQQGHERVVSVLLENDTKGKVKLPALHVTARKDDVKSAALLLQNEQNNVDGQTKTGGLVNDTTKDNHSVGSGFTPLHIAAHYGNTNVGSLLIQRGADVNFKAKNNITPLHVASRWGKPTMITLLLDNKGIADEKTRDGLTPLHCAARSGHENVVDLLIERGAPKSAKTKNGLTPLHMAAQGDHVDCARLLLYHRAPVDDVTVDYLTPLHVAAHCGNVKTAKLLLDRKCDPNSRALNGFTPLHIACKKNRIKVVELLLKYGATIEATTESGLTPLHVASFMGHMNIVIYLIQNNANPDFTTVRGETALHLAARANQTDIIRILLRNGATVDARAREQQTPLHIASRLGNVDNVTLLLQLGAAPDAVTKDLYTPLHIAAKEGHEEVASVLLEHGASHGLTTKKGFTPLHIAAKYGNIKVARLLLQKDANPDCQGKNGLTPLHVATHYNHVNVALLLLDNKASPHSTAKNGYTPLHIAAKKNQMDIATTLLEFGARPDAESKNGFTPLHLAAQEGHTDMVSLLLEHKADVNSKAQNGLTSLHLAAQEDKVNVAEVLVKYGTDIDPQTKAGYTPLHTACHFGQMNMVRFLLERDASVSATTKLGYTPLHQAAQQGHVQVINLLLKNKASPNAVTNNGQTALSIAQRLGYISVVDTLTPVTEVSETIPSTEDKIKLMSPEIMQENPISDSDDEGGTSSERLSWLAKLMTVGNQSWSSMASSRWDDFLPSSPLFGKPLTEQHVYLPFYEGSKMQSREDSISLGEKGGSISPLDTSYEKDVSLRTASTDDARRRITSEIGTAMRYPSYLERGPDYEAEMRYFSGDSLMSPRDKSKDSVFGGDYSTLDRLDTTSTNSESKVRVVDEHGSEIDYDDDLDDRMKKNTAANQFTEDFYLRQSVRYGANTSKRPIYPGSGYKSHPDRPTESYAESFSVDGIDLNDEFKYMPDDSVPQQDYCEAQIMTSSYAAYTHAAPPESHLGPGISTADKPRVGSYSGSSFSASFDPDNVAIDQTPAYSGRLKWKSFLISFMVDARGGAMRGRRHSGIRIIIPPNRASMPTRVTCRLIKKDKLIHPIPLNEGEALAARIIEMGPVATKFLGRIVIEIPHFASLRGKEREIKILRSNNGEKWEEHSVVATDDAVQKALHESMEDLDYEDELAGKRVTRILTDDFPRYFALVTKVKEEKQWVDEKGLIISSTVVPQVQAVFPEGAVNKKIKVGLQAQPISPDIVSKLLGNRVAVSPIVTVEPRRRKFHKNIVLTIPVPKAAQKGMINQYGNEAPTLRVLYSISGSTNALREGTESAVWDDLTDQTELKFTEDCVSFTTRVSGRFWLMDCQNVADACRFATELYKDAIVVPYMARFVVFAKRTGEEEGKLRMFCMTDDRIDKTLEKQEHFGEVARSRDVEVLEGRPQYVEMAGNLIPITKSGDQLYISFKAFRENRLPCLVKIRDRDQDPAARVAFMKEPKVVRGELPQTPICNLNIALPDMSTSSSMEMDPEAALELKKRSSLLREHGIVLEDTISNAKINLSDVADTLKGDWVILATQLDISGDEIHKINSDYRTVNDQALAMLSLWKEKKGDQATGNELERALRSIKREDVVQKCMYNVETIQDEVELAAAKVAMDQSGFDTFAEEIGVPQDSMKRNMSLDVQFDEKDIQKDSESAAESPASEGPAPQAYEEDSARSHFKDDVLVAEISERRALAKDPEKLEKTRDDFFDLIDKLDKYNEFKERQEQTEHSADMEESQTITEEELTSTKQDRPKSDEIIAKVEELGQQMAPVPAQEPTEDEEGTKTPPPSPVEGEFVSEQGKLVHEIEDAVEHSLQEENEEEEEEEVEKEETIIEETFQESDDGIVWRTIRKTTIITPEGQTEKFEVLGEEIKAQQAAVDELAARLSSAEDFAEHPGETETVREVVASQEVQTTESAARQTTVQVGESDVDTGFPFISDQKEPDMEKLVESLKTDLYEKERTEKSGNESDVSSSATSDTEGEFNIDPLPSTAPSSESNKPVVGRQISGERKRKRTDSLSSSSLSDVEDNVDGSMEEKEPVVHKSSLHDASGHEPKTSHVHFKEDLSSSSSSSSTEDETKQMPSIKTESESNNVQSPAPSTPKIDRMEEFQFIEKPTTELKGEKGAPQDDEDSSYVPVKVYKPVLTAQETIEEGLKMLPDVKDGGKEIQPMADSEVEEQIVQAPAPPKEQDSSSSSSSDEDDEKKRQESFREGSIERTERYEEVPPKEQTQIRPHAEGSKDDPQVQPHAEGSKDDPQVQPHAEGSKDDPQVQPHSEGSKDDPQVQPHAEGSKDDPQGELSASPEVTDSVDAVPFTKTVKRLQRMSSQQQQEVIESELLEEEESTTEQVLPDGSKVKRKRFKSGDSGKGENGEQECMELVEEEGPEKEDVKFEEDEEVLDDGTVHRISRTRRQSIKHLKRTLISESGEEENIFEGEIAVPGKAKEDVIEVFEEPAKPVTQVEEIEVKRDDGVVVKRRMVMSRMVSNVKTFHQSFDDSGNLQEDEYAIEAIIPGTESAFVEGDSSSSSSESSEDDDDENDEEINVDDLDRVEEDCQSGTTVTTRQVIKQTFTSGSYTTDGEPRELEDTGLVKRVVKKVTYDPGQPDVISDSTEYDDEVGLEVNTPVITITEDNSKPASEGDDHLAYFGYKSSPDDTELWIDENDFEESDESSYIPEEDNTIAENEKLPDSLPPREANVMGGENIPTVTPGLQLQIDKLSSESRNVFSSYENVYEGVPLDPKINRLSLDASEMEIGDRFDTKQMDVHLQSDNRASSYEQVYAEEPRDQSLHLDLAAIEEDKNDDKISTSSSEVAQHDDDASDEDAEACEATENNMNETDVEEQFSPVVAKPFPKPVVDLHFETENPILSVTDSPTEAHSPCYSIESPDLQDKSTLSKPESFTVGTSPSEYHEHSIPPKEYEQELLKDSTDSKSTEEIDEQCLMCSYEVSNIEEEVVLDQSSEIHSETPANLQNEYPDFKSDSENFVIDTSKMKLMETRNCIQSVDEISPEDLEEKDFQFELPEKNRGSEDEEGDSERSSETSELTVFDENSGTYIRIPWESAYQFRRQFSETYEQNETEKKFVRTMKSIDLGSFYRRDKMEDEEVVVRKSSLCSTKHSAFGKEYKKEVRFAEQIVDITENVDLDSSQSDESEEQDERLPHEPHEQIDKIHEMTVIASIMEKRQYYEEEWSDEVQYQDSCTSTRDDQIEATGGASDEGGQQDLPGLTGDELFARDDVSTETTVTPTVETTSFAGIIVTEAEPVEEKEVNEISSISKEISLTSVGKFPMALPMIGKSIADNEIYESSETGGDTTEEKLSPIDETPQDDFLDEEQEVLKPAVVEKHVKFQTDIGHLRSGSSEDLVKTSTSSSEMEPTILAASYDLDSGRVSKVVATYDVSPDTVEKQFVAPPSAKAILSSPEDDVFEIENKRIFESSRSRSESEESTPSIKDKSVTVIEKSDIQELNEKELEVGSKSEGACGGRDSATSSPFEIMSPSELDGYDQYMERFDETKDRTESYEEEENKEGKMFPLSTENRESMTLQIIPKSDSSFDHSSLLSSETSEKDDSPFDMLSFSAQQDFEPLPDLVENTVESNKQIPSTLETRLPNGPTEVEFDPEIDVNCEQTCSLTISQPDLVQSLSHDKDLTLENSEVMMDKAENVTDGPAENVMIESQTVQTLSLMEELNITSQEHFISSDQTLYGLEMPSEENTVLTSLTQTQRHEVDTESDSVNVTEALVSQMEEDSSDQSISKEIDHCVELSTEKIQMEEQGSESGKQESIEKSQSKENAEIYHGKRALDIDDSAELDVRMESGCAGVIDETFEDEFDNVEEESFDTNLNEECDERGILFQNEQTEPFELDVDPYDLERPSTPTPVDINQHFFDDEAEAIVKNEEIEVQASEFVETVLTEAYARINQDTTCERNYESRAADSEDKQENLPSPVDVDVERNIFLDEENESTETKMDNDEEVAQDKFLERQVEKTSQQKHSIIMKQISEDIPGITLTTHYHDDGGESMQNSQATETEKILQSGEVNLNDTDEPIEAEVQQTFVFSSECIPEEPEDTVDGNISNASVHSYQAYHDSFEKSCIPEENDSEEEKEEVHITSSTRPLTVVFPQDKVDHGEIHFISKTDPVTDSEAIVDLQSTTNEYLKFEADVAETGYVGKYDSDDSLEENYNEEAQLSGNTCERTKLRQDSENLEISQCTLKEDTRQTDIKLDEKKCTKDILQEPFEHELSQDDIGDTSSVESFTTVVPVDQEDDDDGNYNRLDDFASMSSSYHSDVLGLDEDDKIEDFPIIDWTQKDVIEFEEINRKQSEEEEKRRELKRNQEEELLQRFEELKALRDEKDRPLIDWEEGSESSVDSDRYEYMDKTALSVITENSDEDKFEFLDNEDVKSEKSDRIFGSPEDFPPPSPGVNKFFNKSSDRDDISITSSLLEFERLEHEILASGSRGSIENEKDNISVTSSLAEFERFERELGQSSSTSSVEKMTSDSNSKESDKEGSRTSLNDVDKLDKDMERKDSVDSITRRSETSSLASLNEFERLEQEMALADELEAEAQKIVSILESGTLISEDIRSEKSSSLMTYSAKSAKKRSEFQAEDNEDLEDSLSEEKTSKKEVDQAEVDSLDGDVSELTSLTSSVILNQKAIKECDEDSLRDDEESMKISSDSLGEQLGLKSSSDKDKFDSDSLAGQEGIMEKSTDSLEADKKYSTIDRVETDSLCDEDDRQKPADVMQTSVDSLESSKSRSRENLMESSMYSVDSSIFSRSSVETMKSAGSQRSDSSTEIMQVSAESYEERKRREKKWLIDNYHSYRESGHGVEPLIDQEGNVLKSFRIDDNYEYGWDESDEDDDNKSTQIKPFSWGPYEEKKKIYTMAEWEAMKEEKRRASLVTEKSVTHSEQMETATSTVESQISTLVKNTTITTKSISSSETQVYSSSEKIRSSTSVKATPKFGSHLSDTAPQRIASIDDDDFVEYDVTEHSALMHGIPEHLAQKSGPIYIDPETIDSEEDEIIDYPVKKEESTDGAEGEETETHRLTMKKEIHSRTILKDGKEQTFVHEEAQIEQEEDPPEELKESMQQIIDQFMESPAQPDQYKALEHDV
ncbi:ankyrin-2-like isoform X15 [Ostrea edulis]|uniref:ankyrin-2-like isoform X15 n=1 Tax=Ostrea edulis TaxID=37623 RepID=UPI0024AFD56F|nr:ankyrin-2-like isoform X15 [Ostrea edulis]